MLRSPLMNPSARYIPYISTLATFILALSPLRADMSVTYSEEAPTTDIALSASVPDAEAAGYQWRNTPTDDRRDIGQIFTPETDLALKKITVQLQSGSGAGARRAPFKIAIFEVDSLTRPVISQMLASVEGEMPNAALPANTFVSFELGDENLVLKGGTSYGFLLSFEEPNEKRGLTLQSKVTNTIEPAGRRIESADGETLKTSGTTLDFFIQATALPN